MLLQRKPDLLIFNTEPQTYSWRGLRLLAFIYLGTLLFAAIIAPPVYWLIAKWASIAPNDLNSYLSQKDFADYFDRLRWVPLVLMIVWLIRASGLRSWRALGLHGDQEGRRMSGRGFVIGVGLVLAVAALHVLGTEVQVKGGIDFIKGANIVVKALAGGLILGFLEEIVFRGLVFRIFYTACSPIWALGLSAAFFAYTHFEMPDAVWDQTSGEVTWSSGFFVGYWTLFGIFVEPDWLLRFINLTLLGVMLTLLFLKKRSLMFCVGIHAGIVTTLLLFQKWTRSSEGAHVWLWGSDALIDGLPALVVLTLLIILISKRRQPIAPSSDKRRAIAQMVHTLR